MIIATTPVACDGQPHRLGLTDRGQLVTLDHDFRRELRLVRLGGRPPVCVRLVRALHLGLCEIHFTGEIRQHFLAAMKLHQLRLANRTTVRDEPIRRRLLGQFRLEVCVHFFECDYVLPGPVGTFDFCVPEIYDVGKFIDSPTVISHRPGYSHVHFGELNLRLPWRWWRHVKLADLATVWSSRGILRRRLFVQDNLTPGSREPLVRVINQDSYHHWVTQRCRVRDGVIVSYQEPESGSLQWPVNRDYP